MSAVTGVVARQSVQLRRRSTVGWTIGLVGLVGLQLAMYPSVRDNTLYEDLVAEYPEEMLAFFGGVTNLTTPAGYLQLELFSLMLPLLFVGAGIAAAAATLAGEEEAGQLAVVLARPVSRRRLVLEKLAAVVEPIGVLALALLVMLAGPGRLVGLDVPLPNLVAACLDVAVLGVACSVVSFVVGAGTGRRALAIAVGVAVAVGAYVVDSLATLVDALRIPALASPFHHTVGLDPLTSGFHPWHTLGLLVAIGVVVWAAVASFARRDLHC